MINKFLVESAGRQDAYHRCYPCPRTLYLRLRTFGASVHDQVDGSSSAPCPNWPSRFPTRSRWAGAPTSPGTLARSASRLLPRWIRKSESPGRARSVMKWGGLGRARHFVQPADAWVLMDREDYIDTRTSGRPTYNYPRAFTVADMMPKSFTADSSAICRPAGVGWST